MKSKLNIKDYSKRVQESEERRQVMKKERSQREGQEKMKRDNSRQKSYGGNNSSNSLDSGPVNRAKSWYSK